MRAKLPNDHRNQGNIRISNVDVISNSYCQLNIQLKCQYIQALEKLVHGEAITTFEQCDDLF